MNIAFLIGGLEPGRDGVGDYTRSLAQECARRGHECCIIALNDRHVSTPTAANGHGPSELRLPMTMPWPQRIAQAQKLLDEFAPDWVSLQFVPYAFHPKGLVFELAKYLLPLFSGRHSHVMFHELWIGGAREASLKNRIVGTAQKQLILSLIRQLTPQVVHTSNETYAAMLRRVGITASLLPMFGAIPISTEENNHWLWAELNKGGVRVATTNRSEFWLAGFFGALHPTWPPEPLLTSLQKAAAGHSRQVALLSIGRLGSGEALWDNLARQYSPQLHFCKIGEQPAQRVSQYLSALNFGIATSPYSLIGKSSSVTAMLEHGLPVIVNRDDEHFFGASAEDRNAEPLLLKTADKFPNEPACWMRRQPAVSRLPTVARQMLHDLDAAS